MVAMSGCSGLMTRQSSLRSRLCFCRNDRAWDDPIINAVQQVLNHTSRHARVGLKFAGAGVESHATGAIGSLAHIQVCVLEMKNPGTKEPSLVIVKSELLPLMKKDIFFNWIKSNYRKDDCEESKPKEAEESLFPVTEDEDMEDGDVPFGLLRMFQLMMSSKSELFGQTRTGDDELHLLASGAFGNVFLTKDDSVVKLSRHGRRACLQAEEFAPLSSASSQRIGRRSLSVCSGLLRLSRHQMPHERRRRQLQTRWSMQREACSSPTLRLLGFLRFQGIKHHTKAGVGRNGA
jgi:hypothetical protein